MKKIIFLDIDGVLNSTRTAIAFDGYGWMSTPNKKLDPVALALMHKIQEETGCEFVISSTWRKGNTVADFDFLGLNVIDLTPITNKIRGYDIDEWMKNFHNQEHDELKYVIIDDDCDMCKYQMDRFVLVNHHNGFSFENYDAVIKLLNGE